VVAMLQISRRYILDTLWRLKWGAIGWAVVYVPVTAFALRSFILGEDSFLLSFAPVVAIAATAILLLPTVFGGESKLLQSIPLSTNQRDTTRWWCGAWIFGGYFCLVLTPLSAWLTSSMLRVPQFELFAVAATWTAYCLGAMGYFIAIGPTTGWIVEKLRAAERERALRWTIYALVTVIRIALVVLYFLYFDLVLRSDPLVYLGAALGMVAIVAAYFRSSTFPSHRHYSARETNDAADWAMLERVEKFIAAMDSRRHPKVPPNVFGWRVIALPIGKLALRRLVECCVGFALLNALFEQPSLLILVPFTVAATGLLDANRWLMSVRPLKALPISTHRLTMIALALVAYPIITAWIFMCVIQFIWMPLDYFSVTAAMLIAPLQLFAAPLIVRFARNEGTAHWLGYLALCLPALLPFVHREYTSVPVALLGSIILLIGCYSATRHAMNNCARRGPQTPATDTDFPWMFRRTM